MIELFQTGTFLLGLVPVWLHELLTVMLKCVVKPSLLMAEMKKSSNEPFPGIENKNKTKDLFLLNFALKCCVGS